MIYLVFTVRDEPSENFMQLQLHETQDVAIRSFDFAMAKNDMMSFRPEDFSLWLLGEYDSITGVLTPYSPKLIKRGVKNGRSGSDKK